MTIEPGRIEIGARTSGNDTGSLGTVTGNPGTVTGGVDGGEGLEPSPTGSDGVWGGAEGVVGEVGEAGFDEPCPEGAVEADSLEPPVTSVAGVVEVPRSWLRGADLP